MKEMTYERAVEYLERIPKFSPRSVLNGTVPYNLEAVTELLRRLGNPQDRLRFVHIAGTNGKGSTAAFLSRILMESGYKTGLYTSPHLKYYTERIKILSPTEGEYEISKDDFGFLTGLIKEKAEDMKRDGEQYPSEFEIICAGAFLYFLEQEADVVVLETGLGGRLDATNVINTPDLAIITTISYDHTEILGNSLEEIAMEKAGIIKPNGDVIIYPQAPEAEAVFDNVCKERGAWLHRAILPGKIDEISLNGLTFDLPGLKGVNIRFPGIYQAGNASLAAGAAKILYTRGYDNINEASIRKGLQNAYIPGRFELIRKNPAVIADGSHNEEGAMILVNSLISQFGEDQRYIFIMGVLADKEYDRMAAQIIPLAKKFFTVTPYSERALSAMELAQFLHSASGITATPCNSVKTAVKMALSQAGSEDVICVFGSFYYLEEAMELLRSGDIEEDQGEDISSDFPEEASETGSVDENRVRKKGKPKKKGWGLFSFLKK